MNDLYPNVKTMMSKRGFSPIGVHARLHDLKQTRCSGMTLQGLRDHDGGKADLMQALAKDRPDAVEYWSSVEHQWLPIMSRGTLYDNTRYRVKPDFQIAVQDLEDPTREHCEHADSSAEKLRSENEQLRAENEKLRAIVDMLPRTADGVPYVPDSPIPLWYRAGDGEVYCHVPWSDRDIRNMYSTREAAEAVPRKAGEANE